MADMLLLLAAMTDMLLLLLLLLLLALQLLDGRRGPRSLQLLPSPRQARSTDLPRLTSLPRAGRSGCSSPRPPALRPMLLHLLLSRHAAAKGRLARLGLLLPTTHACR